MCKKYDLCVRAAFILSFVPFLRYQDSIIPYTNFARLCLQYVSHAHYVCDKRGVVDVRVEAAVGGSYTGVFPMGLISSLTPAPHEDPALRLYRRDTSLPWKVYIQYNHYSYLLTLNKNCGIVLKCFD